MKKIKLNNNQDVLVDDSQFKRMNKFSWQYNQQSQTIIKYTKKNNAYEFNKYLLRFYDSYNMHNLDSVIIDYNNNDKLDNQLYNINIYNIKALQNRIKNKFIFVKKYIDKVLHLFRILNYQYIALTKECIEEQCTYIEYEYNEFINYYILMHILRLNLFNYLYIDKALIDKLSIYQFPIDETLNTIQIKQKINLTITCKSILYKLIALNLHYNPLYISIIEQYTFSENDMKYIFHTIKKHKTNI